MYYKKKKKTGMMSQNFTFCLFGPFTFAVQTKVNTCKRKY